MLLVHLFVCFVSVSFCHFPLSRGVGGWLRFVICGTTWTFLLTFVNDTDS